MINEYCKECKYYVQAIDGKIVHEVCLMTEDKETDKCLLQAFRSFGLALNKAFINAVSSFKAAGQAIGKAIKTEQNETGARSLCELNEFGKTAMQTVIDEEDK